MSASSPWSESDEVRGDVFDEVSAEVCGAVGGDRV